VNKTLNLIEIREKGFVVLIIFQWNVGGSGSDG
jgi:hypothetical protein